MAADTYTSNLGLILQGTGNNNNNWGTIFNTSFALIADRAISGRNTITATGGTVDLSTVTPPAGPRADLDMIQYANGVLTSHLTVIVPNVSKMSVWANATTGNFNMYVQMAGTGTKVQIPQGCTIPVVLFGDGNLGRLDDAEIGSFRISGKAAAGAGELACNGASLLRADYPNLFNKISTTWGSVDGTHFTLPNFTDTNRFLRAGGGSLAVGTYQASQNKSHTHTGSGTTGFISADHQHTYSGTTSGVTSNSSHSHTLNSGANVTVGTQTQTPGGGGSTAAPSSAIAISSVNSTNTDHTHTFSGSTSGVTSNHTHTFSFTTSTGSADGTEARPESAAVLVCIRY
jgi:microcystin-dependent protein